MVQAGHQFHSFCSQLGWGGLCKYYSMFEKALMSFWGVMRSVCEGGRMLFSSRTNRHTLSQALHYH